MNRLITFFCLLFSLFFCGSFVHGETAIYLRDNLKKSNPGDFIVTVQNKTYTLLRISDKSDQLLTIEEITIPMEKIAKRHSWKNWVANNAPGNTSWIIYSIDLTNGKMKENYSFTKKTWYKVSDADNYLSKLLNLRLIKIPLKDRKKIGIPPDGGGPDWRVVWQPQMVVDGKVIPGVQFDAWRTHWPKDGSDLSGRTIEVYVPAENEKYPSYFPYWLQISGMVGKAKMRIIDSGQNLVSPKQAPH